MLRTIDRYVIREVIPPFLLALLVFTFLLVLPPVMQYLENLLSKGVSWPIAARIVLTLIPQGLGLTIPMALLTGILIGLGRLSTDRETMALLACGVSPYRLLRPVMLLAVLATRATGYVMIQAIPDANQTFREITLDVVSKRVETDIRPRVFFEDFPGFVLYARDAAPGGGWRDVLVADTRKPGDTRVFLAARGRLIMDRERRVVDLVLADGTQYSTTKLGETDRVRFLDVFHIALDADTVFGRMDLPRGVTEKTIAQLRETVTEKDRANQASRDVVRTEVISPHPEIMAIQQKFSIPAACLIFAVIGLALGLTVARDSKLSGFVIGIGVIFAYYVTMFLTDAAVKGYYTTPESVIGAFRFAKLARWIPDIVLGAFGVVALVWRARYAERNLLPSSVRFPAGWWHRPAAPPPPGRGLTPDAQDQGRLGVRPRMPGRKVVVVVRVPRVRIPGPGILDRYISRLYVRVVGLSFLALLGLFYIASFIDRSEKLFKGQATTRMLLEFLAYSTPQFVYWVIPIAALLSVLVTFGVLSRTSELTVMKACGVSLYRIAVPVVVLSLVGSAVLFGLEQETLARANRRAGALDDTIRGRPPKTLNPLNRRWVIGRDLSIYHYTYFDPRHKTLSALSIYRLAPGAWRLESQTYAATARYQDGNWTAVGGWAQDLSGTTPTWRPFDRRTLPIESPEYFATDQTDADVMTVAELRKHLAELSATGVDIVSVAVELQQKLAFPFVTLVMTLLAVPFGVSTGRRGTLYGIGLGVIIALSYWLLSSVFVAIGKAELLSPALAAWTPNIIVTGCAGYLFLTVKT